MKTYQNYIEEMQKDLQEINCKNIVNWCKEELKKSYSERKLKQLEIAKDILLKKMEV